MDFDAHAAGRSPCCYPASDCGVGFVEEGCFEEGVLGVVEGDWGRVEGFGVWCWDSEGEGEGGEEAC